MGSSENQTPRGGRPGDHIATLTGTVDRRDAVTRLTKLSKAGKLAGFEPGTGDEIASFAAFGHPFDGRVLVRAEGDGLRFDLRMSRKMPMIFGAVLAVCVWPGLPLTDAFLQGFGWYERLTSGVLRTWMWYLPLAAIPAPFALVSAIRKSRRSAHRHAVETVERLGPKLTA